MDPRGTVLGFRLRNTRLSMTSLRFGGGRSAEPHATELAEISTWVKVRSLRVGICLGMCVRVLKQAFRHRSSEFSFRGQKNILLFFSYLGQYFCSIFGILISTNLDLIFLGEYNLYLCNKRLFICICSRARLCICI